MKMVPEAMGWTAVDDGFHFRFLYHGTDREVGAVIARTGLNIGRMFAYCGSTHPWDQRAKRNADPPDGATYGRRDKDDECVIVSVALALRSGCRIWATRSGAYLIDRVVPPEAIIAVDQRRGRQSVRIINRAPAGGYMDGVPRNDYWVHWGPNRAGGSVVGLDNAPRDNRSTFEAMLAQAETHLDVTHLRRMGAVQVYRWMSGAPKCRELKLMEIVLRLEWSPWDYAPKPLVELPNLAGQWLVQHFLLWLEASWVPLPCVHPLGRLT